MRYRQAWIGVVALGLLSGCTSPETARSAAWRGGMPVTPDALPADYVLLDTALLQCPAGDPFLNQVLWSLVDSTVVDLEKRAILDGNGFRVGQLVGMAPERLQALLHAERSCINSRRRMLATGPSAVHEVDSPRILLGPPQAHGEFTVHEGPKATEIALENVQYQLEIEPELTRDGRVRIKFTPRVEHGESLRTFSVAPDRSDFVVKTERPSKLFPRLSWHVTLGTNQFLIIGGHPDQPQSLGYQAFSDEEGRVPMQRVLVLRATRSASGMETSLPTLEDIARAGPSPPLALQATTSAVRASGHR